MAKKPWSKEVQEEVKQIIRNRGYLTHEERKQFAKREGKSLRAIANLEYTARVTYYT